MRTFNRLGFVIFLAVLLPAIGLAAGILIGRAWNSGAFARWQRLPDPPASPVQIVGGSARDVYIQASDGQVYSCNPSDGPCWAQDEKPATSPAQSGDCEQYPLHYSVSPAPGKVVDSLQIQWCHFEAGEETNYVVLEDGSVWRWQHWDANFLNLTRSFVSLAGGCLAGLLLSVALVLAVWLRKRAQRARA
jgi:hypothetical protein